MPVNFPTAIASLDHGQTYGQIIPDASAVAAGLMPAQQFASSQYAVSATSPLLDMTATGSAVSFIVPVKLAGFYFVASTATLVLLGTYAGTATASLVVSAGNDAGQSNVIAGSQLTITSSNLNTFAPFAPIPGVSSTGPTAGVMVDGGTEVTLKWAAVTGVTAGHFRVVMRGTWIPVA